MIGAAERNTKCQPRPILHGRGQRWACLCLVAIAAVAMIATAGQARGGEATPDETINRLTEVLPPLHVAAARGDAEAVLHLLATGAAVDEPVPANHHVSEWTGATPLIIASIFGRAEAVRVLLDAGADVHATAGREHVTPLMAASGAPNTRGGEHIAVLRVLLDAGADVNRAHPLDRSALLYACLSDTSFYRAIEPPRYRELRRPTGGAIGMSALDNDLEFRTRFGGADRVKVLLDAGAELVGTFESGTPLGWALYQRELERVSLLLEAGAVVSERNMFIAAQTASAEIFRLMLQQDGVQDRLASDFPRYLFSAAASKYEGGPKIEALIRAGADLAELHGKGRELLRVASIASNDGSVIVSLLEAGVEPDILARDKHSLFVAMASYGSSTALRALLERGADPEERCALRGKASALMLAAASDHDAAAKVRMLLDAGAEVDAQSEFGETALLFAARTGNMDAVIALVEAGADVTVTEPANISDIPNVWTGSRLAFASPLMYVANRGGEMFLSEDTGERAAEALIAAGADVNYMDRNGRTALRLAHDIDNQDVVDVLLDAGARNQRRR